MAHQLLQFFQFEHLPIPLQMVSKPFCDLANEVDAVLRDNPEKTVALRKLLEAKDCAVRAVIWKDLEGLIMFDRVDWEHFNLETGLSIKKGTQYLKSNTSRLQGPGVNNELISRLKKGEEITIEFPALNLKAVFIPRKSSW